MTNPLFEMFSREYLKEFFSRNKIFIIISVLLLIISALSGIIFSEYIKELLLELMKTMVMNVPENPTVIQEASYLFQNNITANFIILLGGVFFSILSISAMIVNGMLIGFLYTLVTPVQYFVGLAPHGIFELPALILSLACAFNITSLEIKLINALFKKEFKEELSNSKQVIKDIIFSIIIITILLIIAAIIEAGVTPALLHMVS